MTALRVAADAAWAEAESQWREVLHPLTLDGESPTCQAHTDEAYAAYQRAHARALALEQMASHSEGGCNP